MNEERIPSPEERSCLIPILQKQCGKSTIHLEMLQIAAGALSEAARMELEWRKREGRIGVGLIWQRECGS